LIFLLQGINRESGEGREREMREESEKLNFDFRFLINGDDGSITNQSEQMYSSFSWDGIVDQGGKYFICI
jgi:hypothetical protein